MNTPSSGNDAPMGAVLRDGGVSFRVWAPHATAVYVTGTFNNWSSDADPMTKDATGHWQAFIAKAAVGHEYRYRVVNGTRQFLRGDPYARQVVNSVGNSVFHDPNFDWADDAFHLPPVNEIAIYELHLGTFHDEENGLADKLAEATQKLEYLKRLGVNVIEVMPLAQFAGYSSWGYNPSCVFAVETNYGGPIAFKRFIKKAHELGIGVVLDVVYNHFGPTDLDLWQFDGWSENNQGGIYFYNDWKAETPWGRTRPDYGRQEVRQFIRDNALMWIDEYHVDGLRFDMTLFIRSVRGDSDPGGNLPDGWSLMQWINDDIRRLHPGRITIAEDLRGDDAITQPVDRGGAGFTAQWGSCFVHPVRAAVVTPNDEQRSLEGVRQAIKGHAGSDPFQRVIYSESHDDVANGNSRIASEIDPTTPDSWFAQKRSTLAAALVLTSPGIPMLFQGQEFLESGWFQDSVRLDWSKSERFSGIVRMYRDLIRLRLNRSGTTRGLTGSGVNTFHENQSDNVVAYHRWHQSGPGDDVVVVVNLSHHDHIGYALGFPSPGLWRLRLNSDWNGYSKGFSNHPSGDVVAQEQSTTTIGTTNKASRDGLAAAAPISIGPYSVLIYSQGDANPVAVDE